MVNALKRMRFYDSVGEQCVLCADHLQSTGALCRRMCCVLSCMLQTPRTRSRHNPRHLLPSLPPLTCRRWRGAASRHCGHCQPGAHVCVGGGGACLSTYRNS